MRPLLIALAALAVLAGEVQAQCSSGRCPLTSGGCSKRVKRVRITEVDLEDDKPKRIKSGAEKFNEMCDRVEATWNSRGRVRRGKCRRCY